MIKLDAKKVLLETPIFNVQEVTLTENGKPFSHPFYRIQCPDWVNILAITEDKHAILIRQHRAGSMSEILETPGGMVDAHEAKDPTQTALRELEEETGYTTDKMMLLASLNPNPALHDNRLHFFLALNCKIQENRRHFPDEGERIEILKVKATELENMVHQGKIDHSLSALCICLAGKYIQIRP